MGKISAVLFDFDGVLIDSLPVMKIAWQSVQEKYKVKANFEQFKKAFPHLTITKPRHPASKPLKKKP